jgi:predicted RNA binding protein YcfA (HicA-like mRNA interferase family)
MKLRELDKMLRQQGYSFDHATGSHYIDSHPTKARVTVPSHGSNV